jgi:hypothetical protein
MIVGPEVGQRPRLAARLAALDRGPAAAKRKARLRVTRKVRYVRYTRYTD